MAAKRGSYSEETLKEAVRLVQDEGYSYREVKQLTGIPRTTIHKYAKSTVVIKKKHGPERLLKVKKDMKRKEAIEKRIKRRQDMNKKK